MYLREHMDIHNEIEKIIKYENASLCQKERKTEQAVEKIIKQIIYEYENNQYDFTKYTSISLNQMDKIRHIKSYEPFSCEETMCIYIKRLLDRKFHIKYPNRNEYVNSLFDMVNALKNMNDYSIFRFDFKNFFNSVSSEYVFYKYILNISLERYQLEIIENFVKNTKFAYAGLNTSNIICEIIATHFDDVLKLKFRKIGLIFYRRYIDDGIIICNKQVGKNECVRIVNETINEVFFDANIKSICKCKTSLNMKKTKYISVYDLCTQQSFGEFDFLGYNFFVKPSITPSGKITTCFKYGITKKKIEKYSGKLDTLVREYNNSKPHDIELLRHQLKAFSFRTVYQLPKYKTIIWKSKGFISNYQELRYRMDDLTDETKDFLQNAIINAFINNSIALPYFLKGNKNESIYNLYNNMKKFKTLLFVETLGISRDSITKMCRQIGIDVGNEKNYDGLVRDYLIKVKVGH